MDDHGLHTSAAMAWLLPHPSVCAVLHRRGRKQLKCRGSCLLLLLRAEWTDTETAAIAVRGQTRDGLSSGTFKIQSVDHICPGTRRQTVFLSSGTCLESYAAIPSHASWGARVPMFDHRNTLQREETCGYDGAHSE